MWVFFKEKVNYWSIGVWTGLKIFRCVASLTNIGWDIKNRWMLGCLVPCGSGRRWLQWSGSLGRWKCRNCGEHISGCFDFCQPAPRAAAAGTGAWSSVSSRYKQTCLNLSRTYKNVWTICMCVFVFLTWPLSSSKLLVSLRRSKETVCFIHWDPHAGESGWKWTRPGAATSPRPATSQEELWKAYLHGENVRLISFINCWLTHISCEAGSIACTRGTNGYI